MSSGLRKMQLIAYADSAMAKEIGRTDVSINPEKYTRTYKIRYNDTSAQGSSGGSPSFNKSLPDRLDFELVFDGTGVVPSPKAGVPREDGIEAQVDRFLEIVEKYDAKTRSPNFVWLLWGDLSFKGRLQTLKITYTLFKPDGTPLRARATATFIGYSDPKTRSREENRTLPDSSHLRTVQSGDTLPLMCHEVYGSSAYYPQVAKVNDLSDLRRLVVGSQLLFPPLAGAPQ